MAAPAKEKSKPAKKSYNQYYLNIIRNCFLILSVLGLSISAFSLYVEVLKHKDPDYKALCDINSYISCSKVLTSRYSRGFGIVEHVFSNTSMLNQPNPVFGLAFYTFHASLALSPSVHSAVAQLGTSVLANFMSVYLAYILMYILHDFCIVCVSTYVVNFLLLVASLYKVKYASLVEMKEKSKKKE